MTPPSAAPFRAPTYEIDAGRTKLAPLLPEDAHRLAALFASIDPWATYAYSAARLEAYFTSREASTPRFAISSDGTTAGVVGLRLDWLRGPFLQFLGIVPSAQGLGLGASVLAWIEAEARQAGERNLWVTASDFNQRAVRFYQRHGYVEAAHFDHLISDGRTEVLLRKRLT